MARCGSRDCRIGDAPARLGGGRLARRRTCVRRARAALAAGRGGRADDLGYRFGIGIDQQNSVRQFDEEVALGLRHLRGHVVRQLFLPQRIRRLGANLSLVARRGLHWFAFESLRNHLFLRLTQVEFLLPTGAARGVLPDSEVDAADERERERARAK
jgi:hypothetical protein